MTEQLEQRAADAPPAPRAHRRRRRPRHRVHGRAPRLVSERPVLVLGTTDFSEAVADTGRRSPVSSVAGFVENLSPDTLPRARCRELPDPLDRRRRAAGRRHTMRSAASGTTRRSIFVEQVSGARLRVRDGRAPDRVRLACLTTLGTGVLRRRPRRDHRCDDGDRRPRRSSSRAASSATTSRSATYASLMMGANVAGSCRIGERDVDRDRRDRHRPCQYRLARRGRRPARSSSRTCPTASRCVGVPARIVKEGIDGR